MSTAKTVNMNPEKFRNVLFPYNYVPNRNVCTHLYQICSRMFIAALLFFLSTYFLSIFLIEISLAFRLTDLENKFMVTMEKALGGRDRGGVWDGQVHTAIFKIDNQQGPTV